MFWVSQIENEGPRLRKKFGGFALRPVIGSFFMTSTKGCDEAAHQIQYLEGFFNWVSQNFHFLVQSFMMSEKKRTIDAFFKPPAKKAKVSDTDSSTRADEAPEEVYLTITSNPRSEMLTIQ